MARARGLPLAVLAAAALAGCGGGGGTEATTTAVTTAAAGAGCEDVPAPEPRPEGTLEAPDEMLAENRTFLAHVRTNCGTFTIQLDQAASPQTVASFVALARQDFYAGTAFHRIVPGFVIQGGDPTGTGTGGPGYTTEDTPADTTTYPQGTVAMAKTAADPPGTAGSQFFVVTAPDAGLPPEYAVIGRVTEGMDVVELIGGLGDPATEQPRQPVVVEDVEIEVR